MGFISKDQIVQLFAGMGGFYTGRPSLLVFGPQSHPSSGREIYYGTSPQKLNSTVKRYF